MGSWQLQEAKAKLSEVIETAKKKGPQIITQRGIKTAVVVPFEEWESRAEWKPGMVLNQSQREKNEELLKFFQSCPDFEIPPRGRMRMRKPVKS